MSHPAIGTDQISFSDIKNDYFFIATYGALNALYGSHGSPHYEKFYCLT